MQTVLESPGAEHVPMAKTTTETGEPEEKELRNFLAALESRTPATAGLSARTLAYWRNTKLPSIARWLVRNKWALDALQADAAALESKPKKRRAAK